MTTVTDLGFAIAPMVGAGYTIWIDYDSVTRQLQVYMQTIGYPKPASAVLKAPLDLRDYLKQEFYFRFAASTGMNCELSWNIFVENGSPIYRMNSKNQNQNDLNTRFYHLIYIDYAKIKYNENRNMYLNPKMSSLE